ncbi:hypothetical protein RIF29_19530 [Crotalaria pallida]|uniref:DNA2/NAM7 helicase-like C-terminal domain-containing protein n=1 Tax=Crotalaria pallida TaxID=3830 RepID=A0AAN9I5K4_CROPI
MVDQDRQFSPNSPILNCQVIAKGVISDISQIRVSVSFSNRLQIPGRSSTTHDLLQQVCRIDKDEFVTSFAIMRFNHIQLFLKNNPSAHLRRMIVDLEVSFGPLIVQSTEARENGMGVSLFCRLSEAHPQAISALQIQYSMCQSIMDLSNALIYGYRLRCGSSEIADAKLEFSG